MAKKILMLSVGIVSLLICGGCVQEKSAANEHKKLKEYYLKNDDALRAKINECRKMSAAEVRNNSSCLAAQAAINEKPLQNPLQKEGDSKPLPKFK